MPRKSALAQLKETFSTHVLNEQIWQEGVTKKLDGVDGKLSIILNTKVNGFDPLPDEYPLQTTLRGLAEVQKRERANLAFHQAAKVWWQQKLVGHLLASKMGRAMVLVLTLLALNSIIKYFGLTWNLQAIAQALHLFQ